MEKIPVEAVIKAKRDIGEPVAAMVSVIQRVDDLVELGFQLVESKKAKKRRIADEAVVVEKVKVVQDIEEARKRRVEEEARFAVQAARIELAELAKVDIVSNAIKKADKARSHGIIGKVPAKARKLKWHQQQKMQQRRLGNLQHRSWKSLHLSS